MKRTFLRVSAGIAVTLAMLSSALMPPTSARAADPAADCLRANNVWVVVQDGDSAPTGGCATDFSTGHEALVSAGFDVTGSDFICQIDGAPSTCSIDDSWWSYWHISPTATGWDSWEFSDLGATNYTPRAGSIEGWRLSTWSADSPPPTWSPPDLDAGSPTAPGVLSAPSDQSVEAGSTVTFSATVVGIPVPTLQWETSSGTDGWAPIAGATTASLTLPAATLDDDGLRFRLVATNSSGTVTTAPATLSVRPFSGLADVPDPNFRSCLNEHLGQAPAATITTEQLGTLTDVSCFYKQVADLTGAEHLRTIRSLDLTLNEVGDVQPLAALTTLETLSLDGNQVSEANPLSALTGLTNLDLDKNRLTSIEALSGLLQLENLSVAGNQLVRLPSMESLRALKVLDLSGNPITSLDPVSALPALTRLLAYSTQIADIDAVRTVQTLEELNIHSTAVADLGPLRGLDLKKLNAIRTQVADLSPLVETKVEALSITKSRVVSLEPLRGATHLVELSAEDLGLTSVEPLAGLPLTKLYLHSNALTDLSPLATAGLTSWGALKQTVRLQATAGIPFAPPAVTDKAGTAVTLIGTPPGDAITFAEAGTHTYTFSDPARKFTGSVIVTVGEALEPTPDPTAEPTATTTATPTVGPTVTSTPSATQTTTAAPTTTTTATATATTSPKRTLTPTTSPPQHSPTDVYSTPGFHSVNGRQWHTTCEPYSQTTRCRTAIWSTQVAQVDGAFVTRTGWHFNNLTYLASPRSLWQGNPLGRTGSWAATDGRKWRTECDTPLSGGNGCRSWAISQVLERTRQPDGTYSHAWVTREVFNNIVRFS